MTNRCPVSQAEIDNDQPYKRVVNRNYSESVPLFDDAAINGAREFKRCMMQDGYAFHNGNMYTIVDAIENIKDDALWSTISLGGKTIANRYVEDREQVTDFYIIGALNSFKTQIENEVNCLVQTVFKL